MQLRKLAQIAFVIGSLFCGRVLAQRLDGGVRLNGVTQGLPFGSQLLGTAATCAAPAYSFTGSTNYGLNLSGTTLQLCINGSAIGSVAATGLTTNNLTATSQIIMTNALMVNVAPTISSGFGTSPSVPVKNGSAAFNINVGTGGTAQTGVIAFNTTAANGWSVGCQDVTTQSATVFLTKQIATTQTTATIGLFDAAGAAAAWAASDILICHATSF